MRSQRRFFVFCVAMAAIVLVAVPSSTQAQQSQLTMGGAINQAGAAALQPQQPASLVCASGEGKCGTVAPHLIGPWNPPSSPNCPSGSFFDGIAGGACWSCPQGFIRSSAKVTGSDACWKPVSENLSSATFVRKHGCPAGTFFDPYNGGGCWSCPGGYNRTWDHITATTACSKSWLGPFSRAKNHGASSDCPAGSFFDPIDGGTCWSCPDGYRRTLHSVKEPNACAKTIDTQYSSATMVKNLGCGESAYWEPGLPIPFVDVFKRQCFSCPTYDEASGEIVAANTELQSLEGECIIEARWKPSLPLAYVLYADSAPVTVKEPNDGQNPRSTTAYVASGAPELLRQLFQDPQLVTEYLRSVAADERVSDVARFMEREWAGIVADPANNKHVQALLFARLVTEAHLPRDQRTPEGGALVATLERFIQGRQIALNQDALDMYYAWQRQMEVERASRARTRVEVMYDYIDVPPRFDYAARHKVSLDQRGFDALVALGSVSNFAAATAASTGASYAYINSPYLGRPYQLVGNNFDDIPRLWQGWKSALQVLRHGKTAFTAYRNASLTTTALRAAITTAQAAGRAATSATAAAFVVGIAAQIVLDKAIADVVQAATMEPNLKAALEEAKKPVDLKKMVEASVDGSQAQVAYWWAKMVEYPSPQRSQLNALAEQAARTAAANGYYPVLAWLNFGGPGSDAGVGEDGSLWVIGAQGSMWRFPKGGKGWVGIPGWASRIAVGTGNDAWSINDLGRVWSWTGDRWLAVCLEAGEADCGQAFPAADVGVASDGTVFVANRNGQLFQKQPAGRSPVWSAGDTLQPVSARIPAAIRVDAGKGGVAILTDKRVVAVLENGRGTILGPLPLRNRPGTNVPDARSMLVADVAIGPDGTYWAISEGGHMYSRAPGASEWTEPTVTGTPPETTKAISIGEPLQPTVLTKDDSIRRVVRQ